MMQASSRKVCMVSCSKFLTTNAKKCADVSDSNRINSVDMRPRLLTTISERNFSSLTNETTKPRCGGNTINMDEMKLLKVPSDVNEHNIPQSSMLYQGFHNPLTIKNSEQFWEDLQTNRLEVNWQLKEQGVNPNLNLDWYKNWKSSFKNSTQKSVLHPIFEASPEIKRKLKNEDLRANYSLDQVTLSAMPEKKESDALLDEPENIEERKFIFECGRKLGVRTLEDWYNVNITDFKQSAVKASEFLASYENSLIKALVHFFPEHPWKIWKFDYGYNGIKSDEPDKSEMNRIMNEAQGNPQGEDWHTTLHRFKDHWQVSLFSNSRGVALANQSSSFVKALKNNEFEDASPMYTKSKDLVELVGVLFPKSKVQPKYSHANLIYSDTKRPFTLDCYIPEYKLAFEMIEDPNLSWQYAAGAQIPIYTFNKAKRAVCERLGISLIQVPSWWDPKNMAHHHLTNAVRRNRPDLSEILDSHLNQKIEVKIDLVDHQKQNNSKPDSKEDKEQHEHHERA